MVFLGLILVPLLTYLLSFNFNFAFSFTDELLEDQIETVVPQKAMIEVLVALSPTDGAKAKLSEQQSESLHVAISFQDVVGQTRHSRCLDSNGITLLGPVYLLLEGLVFQDSVQAAECLVELLCLSEHTIEGLGRWANRSR